MSKQLNGLISPVDARTKAPGTSGCENYFGYVDDHKAALRLLLRSLLFHALAALAWVSQVPSVYREGRSCLYTSPDAPPRRSQMSKPKKEPDIGPCSYCGEEHDREPEHVAPQSIFVNKNQARIVIPACGPCNREKGEGEGDLRDYLIIKVGVGGHPEIRRLMDDMAQAYGKGTSKLARAASEERKLILHWEPSGLHVPKYEVPIPDPLPMDMSLRYMTRGLYFVEIGTPWLKEMPLSLQIIDDVQFPGVVRDLLSLALSLAPYGYRRVLGKDVFKYTLVRTPNEPGIIAWLMVFFGKVAVVGYTGIPQGDEERKLSFEQLIRRKEKREKHLRGIVDRRLIRQPPDNLVDFLQRYEERKNKRTPPR
jgi:hypothetical protein